jgi:hypothetical protein
MVGFFYFSGQVFQTWITTIEGWEVDESLPVLPSPLGQCITVNLPDPGKVDNHGASSFCLGS